MIASDWVVVASVVVGDQGALVGGGGLPVPPERRGQSEQALRDPDNHAGQGAAAVAFQPKLVFEGVEGALDPLPPAAQRAMPAWFVGAVRSQQHRAIAGNELLELAAGEPLVRQDDQPPPQPVALAVQPPGGWPDPRASGAPQDRPGHTAGTPRSSGDGSCSSHRRPPRPAPTA